MTIRATESGLSGGHYCSSRITVLHIRHDVSKPEILDRWGIMTSHLQKRSWIPKRSSCMVVGGLILVAAGPALLLIEMESHAGWAMMFAGLIFMAASRFDDVQEIALASFSMKLFERRVDKVEDAIRDLRRLARESSRLSLASIQFSGRMGGFDEDFKESVLLDTRRLLQDLQVATGEIDEVERLWHEAVEFDYAHWATGLSKRPSDLPADHEAAWKALRGRGIKGRPSPAEIRAMFNNAQILTPEREEILKDYEHYVETRTHRRLDGWYHRFGHS